MDRRFVDTVICSGYLALNYKRNYYLCELERNGKAAVLNYSEFVYGTEENQEKPSGLFVAMR
jgi:hypothetical protein